MPVPFKAVLLAVTVAAIGAMLAAATGNKGWLALDAKQRTVIFAPVLSALALQSILAALEMEPGRSRGSVLQIALRLVPGVFLVGAFALFPWAPGDLFFRHSALCFARGVATSLAGLGGTYVLVRRGYFVDLQRSGAALGFLNLNCAPLTLLT